MPFSPTAAQSMGDAYIDNPVGTGPFKFVSWTRDDRLVVERYDDYWGEPAYLDGITFQPIPDEDSRFSSVLSGDIDAFITLRQSIVTQALQADEDGTMETQLFIGNNGGGAIFNTLTPPVDDPRVRLGLAHAVKQEDLIDILGGTGITPVQSQFFSESSPWYSERVAEVWPTYDAEKAQSLLQEYIDDPERSDGKNPGDPIAVEFNCIPDPSTIELSQGYQAFWEAAGVDVTLNTVEFATHVANGVGTADSDPPFAGDYMVNCWRIGGQQDPYTTFEGSFGPVAEKAANVTNYTSETIDEQIDILRTSSDTEVRKAAVEEIGLELAEQVPLLYNRRHGHRDRLGPRGQRHRRLGAAERLEGLRHRRRRDPLGLGVGGAVTR
jgi:peptide/nickel transport system substrate-binding protein